MKRKQVMIMGGGLALCIGVMLVLYAGSPMSKEIYRASFERRFVRKMPLREKEILDLGFNSYYISGATSNKIYLSNYTSPFHIVVANKILADSQHVRINLIGIDSLISPRRFKTTIDSPFFFVSNGVMPIILSGNINSWRAKRLIPDGNYFVDALPISQTSLILRSYSKYEQAYDLAKTTSIDSPYFEFKFGTLQKQIDGLFCVAGELHYSDRLKRVVYLYSYRNQYIVMDTNLNLSYRGNTIDTFKTARIKIAKIGPEGQSMLAGPPTIINGSSCVSDKYLFVRSNLLARNEEEKKFTNSSVIDVYDLENGKYLNSFYIPNYRNGKFSDFKIVDNRLIALYGQFLILYSIDLEVLTDVETI